MKKYLLFTLAAAATLQLSCTTNNQPLRRDHKAPVENPDDKKGAQETTGTGDEEGWSLKPVGHKGSNLTQLGYLLNPAGSTIRVSGRMHDVALIQKDKFLVGKTDRSLALVNADSFSVVQQLSFPVNGDGGSIYGMAVAADDAIEAH